MKRCTKCGELKPLSDFPVRKDRGSVPRSHCRPCHNADAKTPHAKALQREWRYRTKYGITVAEFEVMLADQHRRCAICGSGLDEATWHLDHDHESGQVRGILCELCNKGLGQFKDNPDRLLAAAAYLIQHQTPAERKGKNPVGKG